MTPEKHSPPDNQLYILDCLAHYSDNDGWARPLDIGHALLAPRKHRALISLLVRGLVERKPRYQGGASHLYKASHVGLLVIQSLEEDRTRAKLDAALKANQP